MNDIYIEKDESHSNSDELEDHRNFETQIRKV